MPYSRAGTRNWRGAATYACSFGKRKCRCGIVKSYDFAAAIQGAAGTMVDCRPRSLGSAIARALIESSLIRSRIHLLILGPESATFYQRVPVPIGMWHPFGNDGVPLHLNGPRHSQNRRTSAWPY